MNDHNCDLVETGEGSPPWEIPKKHLGIQPLGAQAGVSTQDFANVEMKAVPCCSSHWGIPQSLPVANGG